MKQEIDKCNSTGLTVQQSKKLADRVSEALSCLVDQIPEDFSTFDGVGFSLLLKERETLKDIRVLIENERWEGANARLRSIWESRLLLKYIVHCASDKDEASQALYLFDERKRFNIAGNIGFLANFSDATRQQKQELVDAYESLPDAMKDFAEVAKRTERMYDEVAKVSPGSFCKVDVGSDEIDKISEYDSHFRSMSASVHGGLSNSHIHVDKWLGQNSIEAASEVPGLLCAASTWLYNLAETWVENSSMAGLQEVWRECSLKC